MAISDLVAVVPPPEFPDQVGSLDDLTQRERQMGVILPTDYREFAIRYGSGWFLDTYLGLKNPFVLDLVAAATADGYGERVFQRGIVPWPQFPAVPGLLEFGSNENGHRLLFLADGDPDTWPVIVIPHGAGANEFERWDLPLGTFLAKALANDIRTAAVHTPDQPVQPHERHYTRYSDRWDFRDGKWVRKRKPRKKAEPGAAADPAS